MRKKNKKVEVESNISGDFVVGFLNWICRVATIALDPFCTKTIVDKEDFDNINRELQEYHKEQDMKRKAYYYERRYR